MTDFERDVELRYVGLMTRAFAVGLGLILGMVFSCEYTVVEMDHKLDAIQARLAQGEKP